MNPFSCGRQKELAVALRMRQWPNGCDPELQKHVESCKQCSDFVQIAVALREARQQAMPQARLVAPGILWWRAQLRRRNAEMERAGKPLVLVEALSLVCSLAVAVVFAFAQRGKIAESLQWFAQIPDSLFGADALWSNIGGATFWGVVMGSAAMIGVLGGFVAYLLVRSE